MPETLRRARNVAYRLLAYRDRSVLEIRKALEKKEFSPEIIEKAIGELVAAGYLDDGRFARSYGRFLSESKKVGPRYVSRALERKGVAKDLAAEATEELFGDPDREQAEIAAVIEKRLRSAKSGLPGEKVKKRIYDLLVRRGFSPSAVWKAMGEWNF